MKAIGMTEQEIADTLHRSIKTINTQVCQILQDLDCKNTQEAVAKASVEGWLTFKHIARKATTLALIVGLSGQVMNSGAYMQRPRTARTPRITSSRVREVQS